MSKRISRENLKIIKALKIVSSGCLADNLFVNKPEINEAIGTINNWAKSVEKITMNNIISVDCDCK